MLRRVLAATVLLLGSSVAADAETLATGAVYGGSTQNRATCYVFNAGSNPIHFMSKQIIRQDGTIVSLTFDNCTTLAGGRTCGIFANIVNNQAYSCKFVFPESKADVRGVLDIRAGGTVLINSDLR